jgi:O-acetyl-ADP-ribose deacetylase (regulator of RNase III)
MDNAAPGNLNIEIVKGDITTIETDVVVNAANSGLMGGGGVDGAIHRAGGPEILNECKRYRAVNPPLPAGQAMITTAGKLSAKAVVHTVGPVWRGGLKGEKEKLYNAYRNSLLLADAKGYKSISFPAISTGVYGYPPEKAVKVVREAVADTAKELKNIKTVKFILFSDADYQLYLEAMR